MAKRSSNLRLETESTVWSLGKARAVIIEWQAGQPDLVSLRLHGERRRITLPASTLYTLAARAEASAKKKRKAR